MARGAIIMSNLVFTTALIYLANEEADCLEDDGTTVEDCKGRVYGFAPASLMANIAVVSGVLSAFFMPLIGAIVDYTDHRWTVGVVASSLMTLIQMVQIGTVSSTWFPMVILQALAGFFYQMEVMAIYAYLPDMARALGEKVMTTCTCAAILDEICHLLFDQSTQTLLRFNFPPRSSSWFWSSLSLQLSDSRMVEKMT